MPTDRYARQRQVREVGASGQRRLERLTVPVPPGASGDLQALYLERAGVRVERCSFALESDFEFADQFTHAGPRAVAQAAHAALSAVRDGLGVSAPEQSGRTRLL